MSGSSSNSIEVRHAGLNKYRMIRGADRHVVEARANALRAQWNDEWRRREEVGQRRQLRDFGIATKERRKSEANERTSAACSVLDGMSNILDSGTPYVPFDWDSIKDFREFTEPEPEAPTPMQRYSEPLETEVKYSPALGFLEWLLASRKQKALEIAKARFDADHVYWEKLIDEMSQREAVAIQEHSVAVAQRILRKDDFLRVQSEHNEAVDKRAAAAAVGTEDGVTELMDLLLSQQKLPDWINVNYEIDYSAETKCAVVDFDLPAPDALTSLKEVKYVSARDEFSEKHISDAERGRLYDAVLYQVALRVLGTVFGGDGLGHLQRVTFNGWVDYVDRASGMDERACIMTLAANRSDLAKIDLERVDPKECFRSLKGVAASKLIGLAAVAPLQRPRGTDRRLINSRNVASTVDASVNIAAMDWNDFEHLVRQVFQNEFSSANTEVRVTQASRDGGVDAIVFDPDPIKGGKIVIQAKRYTNTVEVSAVRDLYGTVMNEGASKGILVTTSNFGPDARKFAQGKPLALIDGGNFLFLLEKMGVAARIDLKEAKALLKSE